MIITQNCSAILMVRPAGFGHNDFTAESNAFQQQDKSLSKQDIQQKALKEFDTFVDLLRKNKIEVMVIDDTLLHDTPDAVFPNNWISFHADGTLVLYPMLAPQRRLERNLEVIDTVKKKFKIKQIIDLTKYEDKNKFLEGTGSIVFDHPNKIAYACISQRTDKDIMEELNAKLGYESLFFHASDRHSRPIYHTNVMLSIGDRFAVICSESIKDQDQRTNVLNRLRSTGHIIIDITEEQMSCFAGNVLLVKNKEEKNILVMSTAAFNAFSEEQKTIIKRFAEIVHSPLPVIEKSGGGSARCMIAEIGLPLI
jgi:hypothetical protein